MALSADSAAVHLMVQQSFVPCLEWHVPLVAYDKKGRAEFETNYF